MTIERPGGNRPAFHVVSGEPRPKLASEPTATASSPSLPQSSFTTLRTSHAPPTRSGPSVTRRGERPGGAGCGYNAAETIDGHWFAFIGDPDGKIVGNSDPSKIGGDVQDLLAMRRSMPPRRTSGWSRSRYG